MTLQLNHTIVNARDPSASARFLTEILGLPAPERFLHFHVVSLANGVSLDYCRDEGRPEIQHFAFLASEEEFDAILARIQARGVPYRAGPGPGSPGQINRHDGGRGVYFDDPDGHVLEVITRPYGKPAPTP